MTSPATVPLGYLSQVRPSSVDKVVRDGEMPVRLCNYTDVYYGDRVTSEIDFMEGSATSDEIARFRLKQGDVAITKDSEAADDIGIPAYVAEDLPDVVLGYHTSLVRPNADADGRYLYWALQSHPIRDYFEQQARGVTRFALRLQDVTHAPIPQYSLEVQRRIAGYLDAETARLELLLERNDEVLALLAERRASLLEELFWTGSHPRMPLGSLCDPTRPIRYGIVLPGPSIDDGVPLVKGGDVHQRTLEQGTASRVASEIEAQHAKSRVHPGDLLYTIRGSYGDVARVPENLPIANITQDVARIAPKGVESRWLELVLDTPSARSYADQVARGATIRGVNIEDLRTMRVPVPSEGEQRTLVSQADDVLASMSAITDRLRRQGRLLRERRQALISAAVTGELEV